MTTTGVIRGETKSLGYSSYAQSMKAEISTVGWQHGAALSMSGALLIWHCKNVMEDF